MAPFEEGGGVNPAPCGCTGLRSSGPSRKLLARAFSVGSNDETLAIRDLPSIP
jgi:hypothetical protein